VPGSSSRQQKPSCRIASRARSAISPSLSLPSSSTPSAAPSVVPPAARSSPAGPAAEVLGSDPALPLWCMRPVRGEACGTNNKGSGLLRAAKPPEAAEPGEEATVAAGVVAAAAEISLRAPTDKVAPRGGTTPDVSPTPPVGCATTMPVREAGEAGPDPECCGACGFDEAFDCKPPRGEGAGDVSAALGAADGVREAEVGGLGTAACEAEGMEGAESARTGAGSAKGGSTGNSSARRDVKGAVSSGSSIGRSRAEAD